MQTTFDFNRSSQLRIIELCNLVVLPVRARHRAKSLLKALDSHIRSGKTCFLMESTLAIEIGCSTVRTVRRAIGDCEAAGLITVNRRLGRSSEFSLNWSLLLDLSQDRLDDDLALKIRSHLDAVLEARKPIEPRTLQTPTPDRCARNPGQMRPEPRTDAPPVTGYQNRKETRSLKSGVYRQEASLGERFLQPSFLDKLNHLDPTDNAALNDWYEEASHALVNPLLLPDNETDRLYVFAAAEHVLRRRDKLAKPPIACFKSLISNRLRLQKNITDEDYDRAHRRIKAMRSRPEYARKPEVYIQEYSESSRELQYV
jgi:hypothetical protein